jgi:GNAT superfamily N-acetyltransferase
MGDDTLEVRRAHQDDRKMIAALMDQVHGRYNPYWDQLDSWIADERGCLAVAVLAGRVIGFGKLTRLSDDEWWVESIAVDKDHRRSGVGLRLGLFFRTVRDGRGGTGHVRAMVASSNQGSLRYTEHFDFAQAVSFVHLLAEPEAGTHHLAPLTAEDVPWAMELSASSPIVRAAGGAVEQRWRWRTWRESFLLELCAAGEAFRWRDRQGLVCMWSRRGPDAPELRIWLAAAPGDTMVELVREIRAYAASVLPTLGGQGTGVIHWRIPEGSELQGVLEEAGFRRRESYESTFHLVELRQ